MLKLKRFLITSLLLLLPIFIIAAVIYYEEMKDAKTVLEIQALESLKGQIEQIQKEFAYIVSDLMFLAEQNELQTLFDNSSAFQRQALAKEYHLFSNRKKLYDQIRFLDETGMEIVRVNFNHGNPSIVPTSKLQSKGKRYYFRDAFLLDKEEVFVSPLDLNIEKGQIELPLKPMIRFGTPVFDHSGQKRGIVLLNYLGANLLTDLEKRATNTSSHFMLLNAHGFWLKGTVLEDEWGFMYPNRSDRTFGHRFPKEWQKMITEESGQFYTNKGLFTFSTLYPLLEGQQSSTGAQTAFSPSLDSLGAHEYYWKILFHVPSSILHTKSHQILINIAIPSTALILLIIIISAFLTQAHLKHLNAEKALRDSEERFKAIVAAIPIPMAITRFSNNTFLYANEHYDNCFKVQSDNLKKSTTRHFYDNWTNWHKILEVIKQQGYIDNVEFQVQQENKLFWVMASFHSIIFNGESAIISVVYDITERKQAEEKIQQQHEFLQHVIDSLDHPFYVINANNYQISVANAATRALGIWFQNTCHALTHKRSTPCTGTNDPCPLQEVKRTKKPVIIEHIHFDKQGNPRNVEVHGFPIIDSSGNVTQMIEYSLDITERKKAYAALRESEIRYRQMFEKHSSIRLLIDPISTDIVDANPAAAKFYGYSLPTLKQMKLSDINVLPPEEVTLQLQQAKAEQQTHFIVPHRLASHEIRHVEIHAGLIDIKNRQLLYAIIHDITERKQAQDQLHKQNKELQIKNQQLDAFARQLEELQQEKLYKLNKAYERFVPREFLGLLDKQSIIEVQLGDQVEKEITILFSDIRDFTSLSEKMTPQENFNFINSYLNQMEPIISQHHGFIDKYIGDAIMALFPRCADDAVRSAIAMLNALQKYNQERQKADYQPVFCGIGLNTGPLMLGTVGGENRMDGTVISDAVNLASRIEGLTKTYATFLLITEQTYQKLMDVSQYKIRVLDCVTVKGKSEPVTVYEVFDAQPSALIELKLTTLVDFEQGFRCFHNEQFSEAQIWFEKVLQIDPNDRAAQVYLEHCRKVLSMTMPEQPKILIVDDISFNVNILSTFLINNHFEVLVAPNGQKALEIVKSTPPHLILLDVMMPGIDGFETCKRLKANTKFQDIPVIFITSLSDTMDKVTGFELGAVDYITRPFKWKEVLARIKTHLKVRHLQQQLQAKNTELEIHNINLKDKIKTLTIQNIFNHP